MQIIRINIIKTSSPKVQARADVVFEEFTIKGFKILRDAKTTKDFVTPPSYFTPTGWRPLFMTSTKDVWKDLCIKILKVYNESLMEESLNENK